MKNVNRRMKHSLGDTGQFSFLFEGLLDSVASIFYSSCSGSNDSNPHDFHKIHPKQLFSMEIRP
jgi:hypothetical protein